MKICVKFFLLLFLVSIHAQSQELNCSVQVVSGQISGSDKTVFETLQTSIRDFMNNKHWTNDKYLNQERIECSIMINVTQRLSTDQFASTISIQSRRPVYRTSYNSPMFNHQDEDFTFTYVQDQPLEFIESGNRWNLTSVLAYYAYIIIGLDYDSFSSYGGNPYFTKAQAIVTDAQNLPDKGWKAFENTKNRYWITENLFNPQFKPLRECLYTYHRLGFDVMSDNLPDARSKIAEALKTLKKVNYDQPNSIMMKVFFNAKADEIVSLFTPAYADEKNSLVTVLNEMDPGNMAKYSNILTGGK
jgi:hypothetical protein